MNPPRITLIAVFVWLTSLPVCASHLVSGNGFGFVVVSPESARVTKFYAHPYSFVQPDPNHPLSEGIETANFIASLGFGGSPAPASAVYVDDSHVIHFGSSQGTATVFMPFGFEHAALILCSESTPGVEGLEVQWAHPVASRQDLPLPGASSAILLRFKEIAESLLLIPLVPRQSPVRGELSSSSSWAMISLEPGVEPRAIAEEFSRWRSGLAPRSLARREVEQLERWRVHPRVSFQSEKERHLWRQSEVMLRVAQSREPNRADRYGNGLIVASLPDGVWFTPWVRDMAWATVALARMGHRDEARAALLAYFNARPTGKMQSQTAGADYQVSVVRYFGDGAEEPFFTEEGSTNIEFDDWGEVLWVLGEYCKRFHDPAFLQTSTFRGPLFQSALNYIVKPLLANTETHGEGLIMAADTSIWEEREKDKKHFAFSTAAAILGLREFADLAQRRGDGKTSSDLRLRISQLEAGFGTAFVRDGHLHGTLEGGVKNDIDGALLPIINFGIVTDPAVVRDAVQRMDLLRVASGGYRRVQSTYTDPAIFEYWYERQEFLFVDLSLAELYRHIGMKREADALLARIVDKAAADHNIIPEMYVSLPCKLFPGRIGDPTGALPMVGYGAGAYILHLIERDH